MKTAERFLIMLALAGYVFALYSRKEGLPVCLIAYPALALFYAIGTAGLFLKISGAQRQQGIVGVMILAGLAYAYALLALCAYLFGWMPRLHVLLHTGIPLAAVSLPVLVMRHRWGAVIRRALLLRCFVLFLLVCFAAIFPFYGHGAVA